MNEDIVIPLAFFATVIVMAFGIPLVRAFTKRMERNSALPASSPQSDARLERIEQAIEAMSIEVERISEGQRFMAKLLAERPAEPVALPRGDAGDARQSEARRNA
jgi:hypothetical protein